MWPRKAAQPMAVRGGGEKAEEEADTFPELVSPCAPIYTQKCASLISEASLQQVKLKIKINHHKYQVF